MAEKGKSPWVWIGCGCAAIAGIGLVLIAVVTFFGVRTAREMADPEARLDKALQLLAAERIPAGYETELAISIPLFAKLVVLEGDGRRVVFLDGLRTRADLGAAFADDESLDAELKRAGLRVGRRQEVLARAALQLRGAEVRYVLFDGEIDFDASRRGGAGVDLDSEDEIDAEISAVVLVRCSPAEQPRLGLWAGPRIADDDPAPDQAALVALIEEFGFCGG